MISRCAMLAGGAAACGIPAGLAAAGSPPPRAEPRATSSCFLLGLNTSTLRGQKLTVAEEIKIASELGYDAIEPWIRELDDHVKSGGSLEQLGRTPRPQSDRRERDRLLRVGRR